MSCFEPLASGGWKSSGENRTVRVWTNGSLRNYRSRTRASYPTLLRDANSNVCEFGSEAEADAAVAADPGFGVTFNCCWLETRTGVRIAATDETWD
jgi:hypothetical protein